MADELSTLWAFEIELPYTENKAMHKHSFGEFLLCVSGEGQQILPDGVVEMSRGDVFYFPPGWMHIGNGHPSGESCMSGVFHNGPNLLSETLDGDAEAAAFMKALSTEPDKRRFRVPLSRDGFEEVLVLFRRMLLELKARLPGSSSALKGIFLETLAAMMRNPGRGGEAQRGGRRRSSAEERMKDACRFIDANFMLPLDVDRMASATGMSRSHFHAKFPEFAGRPFLDYLNERRVEEARRLLVECPSMPVPQVARSCGFSSLSRFYAEFKRRTGEPPLDYAKARKDKECTGQNT